MKRGILSVVLIGIMTFVCATCQRQAGLAEQDRAAIQKVSNEAVEMANGPNADWGAYVNLYYAEDAKVLVPGMPILEGRDAIKTAFASMGTIQEEKWNSLNIEGRGDLAYEQGTYSLTIIPPGMSAAMTEKGKCIVVWKKQIDGTWKVERDIWNSDSMPAGLAISTGPMKSDAGPELQRLGWLVGTWRLDGESKGSPIIPAGKMSATLDSQWFSGGSQLICQYALANPNGPVQELSIYGYDPEVKAYWNFDMDSTGIYSLGKVTFENNSWNHVWDFKAGGKSLQLRLVISNLMPNSCSWKNDYSVAGGPWAPVAEGTATRIK